MRWQQTNQRLNFLGCRLLRCVRCQAHTSIVLPFVLVAVSLVNTQTIRRRHRCPSLPHSSASKPSLSSNRTTSWDESRSIREGRSRDPHCLSSSVGHFICTRSNLKPALLSGRRRRAAVGQKSIFRRRHCYRHTVWEGHPLQSGRQEPAAERAHEPGQDCHAGN